MQGTLLDQIKQINPLKDKFVIVQNMPKRMVFKSLRFMLTDIYPEQSLNIEMNFKECYVMLKKEPLKL